MRLPQLLDWLAAHPLAARGLEASLLAGLATGLGALPILFLRRPSASLMAPMLGLAGGMMLAASFFSLLVPAIQTVAASTAQGRLALFSNSGNWIDLAAPGELVTSTVPGGGYATWSGTSMATPLVAGAAALLRGRFPQLAPRDVARCLVASGDKLSGSRQLQVDVASALSRLAADPKRCR